MTTIVKKDHSKERGVTLVEVMMVLGIATAFIAGGLALYNNAQQGLTARNAINSVMGAVAEVRGVYAASRTFNGLSSVSVKNPFGSGGTVSVGPTGNALGTNNTDTTDGFAAMVFDNIDDGVCSRVVTALNAVEDVTAWSDNHASAITAGVSGGVVDTNLRGTAGNNGCASTSGTFNYLVVTVDKN